MDGGTWQVTVHGVAKSQTQLSDFTHKITEDGDCSHEIKRRFLLGRKVMTNLDSIFKSICIVKAMVSQWSRMDVRVGV